MASFTTSRRRVNAKTKEKKELVKTSCISTRPFKSNTQHLDHSFPTKVFHTIYALQGTSALHRLLSFSFPIGCPFIFFSNKIPQHSPGIYPKDICFNLLSKLPQSLRDDSSASIPYSKERRKPRHPHRCMDLKDYEPIPARITKQKNYNFS